MRKITKRSAAIVAGSALALTGGTAAFAFANGWFSGDGTVYAASSSIQTIHAVVSLGNTPQSRLYPGKSVAVGGPVNNPNDYKVKINSITVSAVASNKSGCGKEQAHLEFLTPPDAAVLNTGANPEVALGSIKMGQDAEPVCAGATLTVSATMTGEIVAS
jgi:hypothetical protein